MKIKLLAGLVLMLLVAVFSAQNAGVISVRFLSWRFDMSESLVIMLGAVGGGLVGLIVGMVAARRRPLPPATADDWKAREGKTP